MEQNKIGKISLIIVLKEISQIHKFLSKRVFWQYIYLRSFGRLRRISKFYI